MAAIDGLFIDLSNADPAFPRPEFIARSVSEFHSLENPFPRKDLDAAANEYLEKPSAGLHDSDVRTLMHRIIPSDLINDAHVYKSDNLIIGVGATLLFNAILKSLLKPGEYVVYGVPSFGLFANKITEYGGESAPIELGPHNEWKVTAAALDRTLQDLTAAGQKAKFFFHINPHNPTGAVYSREESEALAKVILKHRAKGHPDLLVIDDLAYRGIEYHPRFRVTPMAAFGRMANYSISLFSLSKAFCCPLYRAGFAVAPTHLSKSIASAVLGFIESAPLSTYAAVIGYINEIGFNPRGVEKFLKTNITEYKERGVLTHGLIHGLDNLRGTYQTKEKIKRIFEKHIGNYTGSSDEAREVLKNGLPGIAPANIPHAGYFQLLDVSKLTGKYFGNMLIDEPAKVASLIYGVEGVSFLSANDMHCEPSQMLLRMSYAIQPGKLIGGLVRTNRFVSALRDKPRDMHQAVAEAQPTIKPSKSQPMQQR